MFGRTVLANNTVFRTRVSADGSPDLKAGGVTIDWAAVTAPGSDTTLADGSIIKSGQKFLRYGQIITKETTGQSQTLHGTATGGTFTLTGVRPDTGATVTTGNIAFNATAAAVLTALQAVFGPNQLQSTSGGALGTADVVVNFNTTVGLMTVNTAALTGGTVTNASTTNTGTTGYFGPYDPAATDGRQTLTRGECFVLDQTVVQFPAGSALVSPSEDQVGGCVEGGLVFIDRILQSGTVAHTLALGPTKAELLAAFPSLRFVED